MRNQGPNHRHLFSASRFGVYPTVAVNVWRHLPGVANSNMGSVKLLGPVSAGGFQ
jgi:hypothetical protein